MKGLYLSIGKLPGGNLGHLHVGLEIGYFGISLGWYSYTPFFLGLDILDYGHLRRGGFFGITLFGLDFRSYWGKDWWRIAEKTLVEVSRELPDIVREVEDAG